MNIFIYLLYVWGPVFGTPANVYKIIWYITIYIYLIYMKIRIGNYDIATFYLYDLPSVSHRSSRKRVWCIFAGVRSNGSWDLSLPLILAPPPLQSHWIFYCTILSVILKFGQTNSEHYHLILFVWKFNAIFYLYFY